VFLYRVEQNSSYTHKHKMTYLKIGIFLYASSIFLYASSSDMEALRIKERYVAIQSDSWYVKFSIMLNGAVSL